MENFKFFAFQYLNDWIRYDWDLVRDFRSESGDARLKSVRDAAEHYKIARNFKERPDKERWGDVLEMVEAAGDSITNENVDSTVCNLAGKFKATYGKYLISAASKFLWIRHQSPVVIYDSRANQCLEKECGRKLGQADYAKYRSEWVEQFGKREDSIRSACAQLLRVKDWSIAYNMPDESLSSLASNGWFHERVFDQFLWWNGAIKSNVYCPGSGVR